MTIKTQEDIKGRITKLRQEAGLSQEALAKQLGFKSRQAVQKLESKSSPAIGTDLLLKIAERLGYTLEIGFRKIPVKELSYGKDAYTQKDPEMRQVVRDAESQDSPDYDVEPSRFRPKQVTAPVSTTLPADLEKLKAMGLVKKASDI